MKKIVVIVVAGFAVMVTAGVIVLRTIAAKQEPVSTEVSPKAAHALQQKIDAIKAAENNPHRTHGTSRVELSEAELESYLLYALKDEIPAQVDSAHIQLGSNTVGLDTQITFTSNATGNPVVDALVGGTHNLFLKGKFIAEAGRGKFDLQDVRVDGIPVPNILIQSLLKKYVKPKHPEVDLNEPFDMPYGIQELKLEDGKATVVY